MTKQERVFDKVKMLGSLTSDERAALEASAQAMSFEAGAIIYGAGDPGSSMFVVVDGAVDLLMKSSEGKEEPLLTVRTGSIFGLAEVVEPQPRTITAKAVEPTKVLSLDRSAIDAYTRKHPESGARMALALAVGLSGQLRIAVDLFRQNLAWTLDVSGAAALNLPQLIANSAGVQLELSNGKRLTGVLLKVERAEAGFQLLIRDKDRRLHLVPYHAVASISFAAEDVHTRVETGPQG
jgi:CRP-like cAMP-binding protein